MGGEVLVVDDSQAIRTMVTEMLADDGILATAAPDVGTALDRIGGHRPCVVLLDLSGDAGADAAFVAAVRQLPGPRCPVVVFTARKGATEHAQRIGADGVLEKPFELDALLSTVRRHIG